MDGSGIGRTLIVVGLLVVLVGVALAAGVGLGRLPGDLSFGRGNFRVYAPIATCLILSVVLTVLANLFLRR